MNKESILGKLIIRGRLLLKSPLLMGAGTTEENNQTDIQILKDKKGRPFIPGTSLTGVIRQYVEEENSRVAALLFGTSRDFDNAYDHELQSSVTIYDVKLSNADIVHRDSVNIDSLTGTTVDTGKFDYEVVEEGAHGTFAAEILFRGIHEPEEAAIRQSLNRLGNYLSQGFNIGGRTSVGFGQTVISDIEVRMYDFRKADDTASWFLDTPSAKTFIFKPNQKANVYPEKDFIIKANFALSGSMLVRDSREEVLALSDDESNLKTVMMQDSDGNWLLPGTSIKGVLRHRAEFILRTLGITSIVKLDDFMGPDPDKLRNHVSEKKRSRFKVNEAKLTNNVHYYPQARVRIDRFTGGNIDGSLFTEGPIWQKDKKETALSMEWEIRNAEQWEIGLAILLLKDVWLGKVAFGGEKNIGRGTLIGLDATLYWENKEIKLAENGAVDSVTAKTLQGFVDVLLNHKEATA